MYPNFSETPDDNAAPSPAPGPASSNPSSLLDYLKMVAPMIGAGGPVQGGGGSQGGNGVRYTSAAAPVGPSGSSSGRDAAIKMGTSALSGGGAAAGGAGGAGALLGSL